MIPLLLATHNQDKVQEISFALESLNAFMILSLNDLPDMSDVEETETSLEGNALKKAREIYRFAHSRFPSLMTLSDDTGLEVDALSGSPGVHSARYAQPELGRRPTYSENVDKLLRELEGEKNRAAQFRTVIALVGKSGQTGQFVETTVEGIVKGEIANEPRGAGGFGYDSVFYFPELSQTFAEMQLAEKNRVGHRGQALKKAIDVLRRYI